MNTSGVSTYPTAVAHRVLRDKKLWLLRELCHCLSECRVSAHKPPALPFRCLQNERQTNVPLQLHMAFRWEVYHFDWAVHGSFRTYSVTAQLLPASSVISTTAVFFFNHFGALRAAQHG